MDRGLADPELLCRRADRGPVLYDVKGQLTGPFLDIPFHTATTPPDFASAVHVYAGERIL
jgi:hypothetical protein